MTHRMRFRALACAWSALVLAALVALPSALRNRLSDPIATHLGFSVDADGATSLAVFPLLLLLGFWLAVPTSRGSRPDPAASWRLIRPSARCGFPRRAVRC